MRGEVKAPRDAPLWVPAALEHTMRTVHAGSQIPLCRFRGLPEGGGFGGGGSYWRVPAAVRRSLWGRVSAIRVRRFAPPSNLLGEAIRDLGIRISIRGRPIRCGWGDRESLTS